jgi:hypothetical protein
MGKPKWSNGGFGKSDIEGKAAMVAASELGGERVSSGREHMSQCGQRASFNRDRDLADEPHWCSSVFGCRNACGVADKMTSWVSDLEATFAAPDFYAKPRSEIFELETQLKTARDKVAHLYARWHELELIQSVPSP